MNQAVGRGDAFEEMLEKLRRTASSGRVGELPTLLQRRLAARVLTWSWLEDDELTVRLLNPTILNALARAQTPHLTRITLQQLIQLYFRRFDLLDTDRIPPTELRAPLEELLHQQLAAIPARKGQDTGPDAIATLKREGDWLIALEGPQRLAEYARRQGRELSTLFAEFGLEGLDDGRYADICRSHFYLGRLRELPLGQADEVFDELLKPSVARAPFESDRRIGHAALEILIDRAGDSPGDAWQDFILELAGDPRLASTAKSFREWWQPLGEERIRRVRGWLSKEDLRLFLEAVVQYGEETGNSELQRMFGARKTFLEGLFTLGLVRNTRLMLGYKARASVNRILSKNMETSFAKLDGQMADKAVIYLDCGDFCLLEGSHNFRIWAYLAPPSNTLLSYEKKSFSYIELIRSLPMAYEKAYPGLPHIAVTHNSMWQRRIFDFLAKQGIALDIEQLLSKQDYKIYRQNHGLPVVANRPRQDTQRPAPPAPKPHVHASFAEEHSPSLAEALGSLDAFEKRILVYIAQNPGTRARQIARLFEVDTTEINHLLAWQLKPFCVQGENFGWAARDGVIEALVKLFKK